LGDSSAPASHLVKQVDQFGDLRVGDKVLNPVNGIGYTGKVKRLYADGTVLVSYGWTTSLGDSFAPASHLIKQG
jgi:hypothetical protein